MKRLLLAAGALALMNAPAAFAYDGKECQFDLIYHLSEPYQWKIAIGERSDARRLLGSYISTVWVPSEARARIFFNDGRIHWQEKTGSVPPEFREETIKQLACVAAPAAELSPQPVARNSSIFPLSGEFFFQRGEKYASPSGNHYLLFQDDGNLVVYTKDDRFVWGLNEVTDRFGRSAVAIKQDDGNLVLYDEDNQRVWSARNAASPPGTKLSLDPVGKLQLIDPQGNLLWSSQ